MIQVTPTISIDEDELVEHFIRASGPGGQNVNRVATAVELRFNVDASEGVPASIKPRLRRLAGQRMTRDGEIVIKADRYRSQQRNREDARERLFELIRRAAVVPRPRIKTQPTRAARERRLDAKARRGNVKRMRRSKPSLDS